MLFKKLTLVGFSAFFFLPRFAFSSHEKAIIENSTKIDPIHIIDTIEMSSLSRDLEEGNDCDVAVSISCIVVSTGKDCTTLRVPLSSCNRDEKIQMTYRVKSEDTKPITFNAEKTILKSFNQIVPFNHYTDLEPGGARRKTIIRSINTCNKQTIVGSIKVEGRNDSSDVLQLSNDFDDDISDEDKESYCFAWEFYKVHFRIPSPAPLLAFTIQCFFENDNGEFHVPCADIKKGDFTSTTDLTRNVLYRFMVNNLSTEPVDVTQLSIFHGNNVIEIVADDEWIVHPSSFGEREESFLINLGDYSNMNYEITADVVAVGTKSRMVGTASGNNEFLVPDFFAIDVSVQCYIWGTDEVCAEYMSRLSNGDENCEAKVIYRYEIENTGLGCGPIYALQSNINNEGPSTVSTDGWISNVNDFCAADVVAIDQIEFDNLCDYFGTDVLFEIEVNRGGEGRTAESFIGFPIENSFGIVDDGFVEGSGSIVTQGSVFNFEITDVQCYVFVNGIYVDCQEYLYEIINAGNSVTAPFSNQCWQKVYFKFSILHTGDKCQTLDSIDINIEGEPSFVVDASQWTPAERRQFCPDDTLEIDRKENSVNVCSLVGNNVSIKIENTITTTALSIRTKKVSCTLGEIPEKLFFEYTGGRCSSGGRERTLLERTAPIQAPSSNSRKGGRIPTRNLRTLRRKGKGGKGQSPDDSGKKTGGNGMFGESKFKPNPCQEYQDGEAVCTDFKQNQQRSSRSTPRFENGSSISRNDFALSNGLIEVSPNSFSNDICVNVYDYNQDMEKAYFQSFTFDISCTKTLTLGDEFGSFKLVRFVIAGVEYNH